MSVRWRAAAVAGLAAATAVVPLVGGSTSASAAVTSECWSGGMPPGITCVWPNEPSQALCQEDARLLSRYEHRSVSPCYRDYGRWGPWYFLYSG